MIIQYDKYICPICTGTKDLKIFGCGILIGNHLFTAGHLLEHSGNISVMIHSDFYELNKEDAILFRSSDSKNLDTKSFDVAIFKVKNVFPSPLMLANEVPTKDDQCVNVSYENFFTVAKKEPSGSQFTEIHREVTTSTAQIKEISNNLIICDMLSELNSYCIGSPLIIKDKVIGILIEKKDSKYVYQSAESINRLLEEDDS